MPDCTLSYDNRETCTFVLPSSCIPYVGYISPSLLGLPECKPNINDIFKSLQEFVDRIKTSLGDNTTLTTSCLTFVPATVTQVQLNQLYINEICTLKTAVALLGGPIDPNTINVTINLLCLLDPSCTPATTYTLQDILDRLIAAYCSLLTRVTNIETILNI